MALVTQSEIKALMVNPAFDETLIKTNHIDEAQIKHLKPLLSDNLYHAVVASPASYSALISGETYTNSEGYTRVYRGLKNFICYASLYNVMKFFLAQIAKQGIVRTNTETSSNTTASEFTQLREFYFSEMNLMKKEIKEYLEDKYEGNILYSPKQCQKEFYGGILL